MSIERETAWYGRANEFENGRRRKTHTWRQANTMLSSADSWIDSDNLPRSPLLVPDTRRETCVRGRSGSKS
jgi:hypothetical protein